MLQEVVEAVASGLAAAHWAPRPSHPRTWVTLGAALLHYLVQGLLRTSLQHLGTDHLGALCQLVNEGHGHLFEGDPEWVWVHKACIGEERSCPPQTKDSVLPKALRYSSPFVTISCSRSNNLCS